MKKLWLCCFLILTSPVFAAERTDYRDWDKNPEKRQQVVKKWDAQFEGVKKQIALTNNYANGSMRTVVDQINGEDRVRTQIRDSGYDPDTGKKIRIEANVTQTANKAKVASTLVDRLGKAKDYAKHVGKASIPTFVGTAAFHGLMEGVGWVMDEGGKVTKLPTPEDQAAYDEQNAKYTSRYTYQEYILGQRIVAYSLASFCSQYASIGGGTVVSLYPQSNSCTWRAQNNPNLQGAVAQVYKNPDYDPSYIPSEPPAPVATDAEIENALKNALESNNPALAAAIAEAIEDAYAYDPIAGSNDLYSSRVITKTFIQLAEQIKQNASSINIETALHAENYIDQVANSIFDLPPAKQFVLYADLITQFDLNKTLRN